MRSTAVTGERGDGPDILVAGEALIDVVHRHDGTVEEAPGGSPANVALALGRLGRRPRLLTALGTDPRGERVRLWLEASQVRLHAVRAPQTSISTAYLGPDGAAHYDFSITWDLRGAEVPEAEVLHIGSLGATVGPGASEVSDLVDRHRGRALVTYDPNIRPRMIDDGDTVRDAVHDLIRRADVVKASDEDLDWLHPGADHVQAARSWCRTGPGLVVVTRGRSGALAVSGDRVIDVPGVPTEVVDTVGAGDTFMGALIDGLASQGVAGATARTDLTGLGEGRLSALVRRAARAAAVTVSRPGADPPTTAQLDGMP
ncbi:carbohydrate kinase [Cellulomonas sp. RIT-PI-Y]|uniref:carbohydrate kinase family protein n=1 Tax=Cellulomonas sp. RIT-PI-Y TaxID=3035297 RepID=UPI0021DA73A6|nr:carbohydrate kinase [Cellulomonas sp. RIT-PI-Y]